MSNLLELKSPSVAINPDCCDYSLLCRIDRIAGEQLTYNEFYWNYMKLNKPVIITSIGNDWNCSKQWVKEDQVDLEFLASKIGNAQVPVANCSKVYFNSHEKIEMPFSEYVHYWNSRDETSQILYLKDWHLKAEFPDYQFYNVPKFFTSDWLNEYLINTNKDDYRFVYIGPRKSWTPFHADVFSSFSWSTNIIGIKKWLLLPPGEELKLKDPLGNDPFSINENLLDERNVKYFTILQNPNESIFVPSKWYHQVWNLTDTISVNHNWFNGCNIHVIWQNLKRHFENVLKEIDDCKDMENYGEHVQIMLKSVFGINFEDFLDILEYIGKKRISEATSIFFDEYEINLYHKLCDLKHIADILEEIVNDSKLMDCIDFQNRCTKLMELFKEQKIK